MLNVAVVNWRNYCGQGIRYVETMADMVARNMPPDVPYRFVCFTDDRKGYSEGIETRPLPDDLDGWYNKLWLFSEDAFPAGDRVLFLDLDSLITGKLDDIAVYTGGFAALENVYEPTRLQSSVMLWEAGTVSHVWRRWLEAGMPVMPDGDQQWIGKCIPNPHWLQGLFPGQLMSYKAHVRPNDGPTPDCRIVFCHGPGKPHELDEEWARRIWRIGGDTRPMVMVACNTPDEVLFRNVELASWRPLEWVTEQPENDLHAVLVGGGPSLVDTVEEIRWRQSIGQKIFALNGAAAWLTGQGIAVDFHIVMDARPENVRFVEGRHAKAYYLASQCDPSLFNALEGEAVSVFHPIIEGITERIPDGKPFSLIGGGTTVGLSAMALVYTLGYRFEHLYGYDSSFRDDVQHAYPQDRTPQEKKMLEVFAGGKTFRTNIAMMMQAEKFQPFASALADLGAVITVHGNGLLPHVAHRMASGTAVVDAAKVRADAVLSRLPSGPVVGAEIGVFVGAMSAHLLGRDDLALFMVDSWAGDGKSYSGDSGDWHAKLAQWQQDGFMARAGKSVAFAGDRARIVRAESRDAARTMPDGSLDFVFIDADHSEAGCRADIAAWLPKLKPGGLLSGHDYGNTDFQKFGVTRAVDGFAAEHGLTVDLGDNFCWFIRIPQPATLAA